MTWNPPDLWATIILSILGGVIAGIIVVVGELAFMKAHEGVQRRKAIGAISNFFGTWESEINGATDILAHPDDPNVGSINRASVQFAYHKTFLGKAPNLIARWSRYLTAEQVEELNNHLEVHQIAHIGILPAGRVLAQTQYDMFFSTARGFKWLVF